VFIPFPFPTPSTALNVDSFFVDRLFLVFFLPLPQQVSSSPAKRNHATSSSLGSHWPLFPLLVPPLFFPLLPPLCVLFFCFNLRSFPIRKRTDSPLQMLTLNLTFFYSCAPFACPCKEASSRSPHTTHITGMVAGDTPALPLSFFFKPFFSPSVSTSGEA